MKYTLTALVLLFMVSITSAQSFKELADTQFTSTQQYKTSEQNVIHSVDYLFTTPNTKNENRALALQFIMKWMQGTPNYTFNINQKVSTLTEGNENLLELYKAGMAKISIENKDKTLSSDALYLKTGQLLATYCANKRNKMKSTAELKKIVKNKKG